MCFFNQFNHKNNILEINYNFDCNIDYIIENDLKTFIKKKYYVYYESISKTTYQYEGKSYKIYFSQKHNYLEYKCTNNSIDIIIMYEEIIPFAIRNIKYYTDIVKIIILRDIHNLSIEDQRLLIDICKNANIFIIMTTINLFKIRSDLFEYCNIISTKYIYKNMYENYKNDYLLKVYKSIDKNDIYKIKIDEILQLRNLTKKDIVNIRNILSDLLVSNINIYTIFQYIFYHIYHNKTISKKMNLLHLINKYDYETINTTKFILHLESFFLEYIRICD